MAFGRGGRNAQFMSGGLFQKCILDDVNLSDLVEDCGIITARCRKAHEAKAQILITCLHDARPLCAADP
ncbi:hypothetical protein LSUCC0246_03685 [Rhodobacterales bacterium LSUCC0246]|nr:hypothetical protein [Rhodobacterales bacterium LSUCC0374]